MAYSTEYSYRVKGNTENINKPKVAPAQSRKVFVVLTPGIYCSVDTHDSPPTQRGSDNLFVPVEVNRHLSDLGRAQMLTVAASNNRRSTVLTDATSSNQRQEC